MKGLGKLEPLAYLAAGLLTVNNQFIIHFPRAIVYFIVCTLLLGVMLYPVFKEKLFRNVLSIRPYLWYMIYTIGLVIVSAFIVEGYDGMQFLIPNSLAMLCFGIVPAMAAREHLVPALRMCFHVLPFMCLFFGGIHPLGMVLIPYALLMLFIGEFSNAKRWILLIIALFVCLLSYIYVDRAFVAKMGVALVIGFGVAHFPRLFEKWVNFLSWSLILLPFLFIFMYYSSGFNVFEFDKYLSSARGDESGMYDDTRTKVYEEVVNSAKDNNYIWFGRSLSRGYDTEFILSIDKSLEISKQTIERGSEVATLNLFTWGGLIYLLLYFIWQCNVVYLGLKKSNNRYTQVLALYVAFYWAFSWVENVQVFSLFYIYGIIIMAMCMSPEFREMDDDEFREMIHEIF